MNFVCVIERILICLILLYHIATITVFSLFCHGDRGEVYMLIIFLIGQSIIIGSTIYYRIYPSTRSDIDLWYTVGFMLFYVPGGVALTLSLDIVIYVWIIVAFVILFPLGIHRCICGGSI